jgi:hypothetical protein
MSLNRGLALLLALSVATLPRPAAADGAAPDKQACVDAYEQGQRLMRQRRLIKAREELLVCARDPCPKVLQGECTGWLADTQRSLPSVVLGARRSDGRDETEVRVVADGVPLLERLDGRAVEVDPGEHVFRFEPSFSLRALPVDVRVVVREGEKARDVVATLESVEPVSPAGYRSCSPTGTTPHPEGGEPHTTRPPPWTALVAAGVGVAALGSFAYFGATGLSRQHSELDACNPSCPGSLIGSVRTDYVVADVSLAVSVIALGLATYLFWTRPSLPGR